jgi:ferredoxin-NADP reductase
MKVVELATIASGIKLISLAAVDGQTLPGTDSGAHIGLILPNGMERQYSILRAEAAPTRYRVAVKREPTGQGGSTYVHDRLQPGTTLDVVAPANNFPLVEDARHSVLIAGGIGITPVWCMVQRLLALDRSFELHYACRMRAEAAFLREIAPLSQAHLHFDDETGGRPPDIGAIVATAAADAQLYCCGPAPMLSAFEAATKNCPSEQVHVEYFTPRFAPNAKGGYVVVLARSQREVTILPGKTILETLRGEGIDVCSSCEQGICGACETRVLDGTPDHRDSILSAEERARSQTMFICCSGSTTERLVLDL